MNKYNLLWKHVKKKSGLSLKLSFDEIEKIAGIPFHHSFLTYKKELLDFG